MSYAKFLLIVALCASAQTAQTPPTEPRQLLAYIDRLGAARTIRDIDDNHWQKLLDRIDTGAPLWLDVARKLGPAADAGGTVGMRVSLAVALTHNPEGVLSMVGGANEFPLQQVCQLPFMEPTKKQERNHVLRVRAALRRVVSPALAAKKTECLKIINEDAAKLVPKL